MSDQRYVLDTSAIFAYANDEPGADQVEEILEAARQDPPACQISVPFMALMEMHYQLLREMTSEEAAEAVSRVQLWPATFPESDPVWRVRAAEVKALGRLSVADAWIASLAYLLDAQLVHKDPEYDALDGIGAVRLAGN